MTISIRNENPFKPSYKLVLSLFLFYRSSFVVKIWSYYEGTASGYTNKHEKPNLRRDICLGLIVILHIINLRLHKGEMLLMSPNCYVNKHSNEFKNKPNFINFYKKSTLDKDKRRYFSILPIIHNTTRWIYSEIFFILFQHLETHRTDN